MSIEPCSCYNLLDDLMVTECVLVYVIYSVMLCVALFLCGVMVVDVCMQVMYSVGVQCVCNVPVYLCVHCVGMWAAWCRACMAGIAMQGVCVCYVIHMCICIYI